MAKMPWVKFYPDRWLFDTRILTDAEKAVWIDLLCFMWNAPIRGQITGLPGDIARMVHKSEAKFMPILAGLKRKNVLNLTEPNPNQTEPNRNLTITSRRMFRDESARESNRKKQKRHYDKTHPNPNLTGKKIDDKKRNAKNALLGAPPADLFPDSKPDRKRFTKPTSEEITAYGQELGYQLDGQRFFDYYEARGWLVGRHQMKDWRATVRTWKRRDDENGNTQGGHDWRITQPPEKS